jgi:glycosyltransferase involved in cell wall biosynthesis
MKVLILITKSNGGGAQRYVYDLATNLPKSDFEVEVMAGGGGVMIDKLTEAGIKSSGDLPIGRDINIFDDIKAFFKLVSILKQKKPDVLHVNSSKIGGLGALAGRLVGIKNIIFTAHGWAFNENRTFISKFIIKTLHWLTIFLSHRTISVSEALTSQMENWPFVKDKVSVVHNGIKNEAIFSKINARFELAKINPIFDNFTKNNQIKDLVFIGSVGELHHIKGYEYAIAGIKKLNKKFVYLIIGDGEHRTNIENKIKELGLENSVLLLGRVPNASHYLKAFDIFLMTSLSEGLPYVLLEAGIAQLPIVATAVGGIPEVIDDMESGILIQSKKEKEILHAIEYYLNHKKTLKEFGTAIQTKIIRDFSIDKMISETIEVYKNSKI